MNVEEKKLLWKINLDQSSIFSGPIIFKDNLLVSTLGGNLFSLDCLTGFINWKFDFGKPTFTSPIINKENGNIFIGTCGGQFYCLNNNEIVF